MKRLQLLALVMVLAMIATACGGDSEGSDTTQAADGGTAQSDAGTAQSDGETLTVVASTTIWGDVVSNVVGDSANVEVLLPIGADPHDYQLSAAQAAMMQEADLVVVNGLALEEGLLDVIESLEADGANILELADELNPIEYGEGEGHDHDDHEGHDHGDEDGHKDDEEGHDHDEEGHDHDEEGHDHDEEGEHHDEDGEHDHGDEEGHKDDEEGHDHDEEGHDHDEEGHKDEDGHDHDGHDHQHGSHDPHVWMDPLRVADAAELIAKELANLDSSVDWMANATAYADQLRALDAELVSTLAAVSEDRRKLVTNHDAFGYFAARYDFEVVGTVIPSGSTLADPSNAQLAELIEVLIDESINVIFTETIEPAALAEAVAAEVDDVAVVELFTGSLSEAGGDAVTYVDYVRTNASRIADALS